MEIRFSTHSDVTRAVTSLETCGLRVENFRFSRGREVRFSLPDASVADHDRVIRALLTLDPDATVRTARAVYEGLEDFVRQCEARTNAPLAGARAQRGKA